MSSPSSPPNNPAKPPAKARYISSSGHVLETPPLTARASRLGSDIYNFLGLYLVTLFSFDPYAAAQASSFNTRGPGAGAARGNTPQSGARWGLGGGGSGGVTGGRGGGGGGWGGAGGSGRRLGQVNDIREPECGSCG